MGQYISKSPYLPTNVGNLAPDTTDHDLRSKFEKYGPVIEAS